LYSIAAKGEAGCKKEIEEHEKCLVKNGGGKKNGKPK